MKRLALAGAVFAALATPLYAQTQKVTPPIAVNERPASVVR